MGCDIGGFDGSPSGELYTRWLQAGVFYPFMRSHSTWGSPDKEPWSFDYPHELINRRAIELRYELLPYIYNAMQQASQTGVPALRPLFLEYPGDEKVAGLDDEFLFGDRPARGAGFVSRRERTRRLPASRGNGLITGPAAGLPEGRPFIMPVTLDSIPLFVRGGGFIFRQPVVQNTGEMPGNPLRVLIAPAGESESSLYEDNGQTLDYRKGAFMTRRFHQTGNDQKMIVDVSGPEGTYRPAARDLVLETWTDHPPKSVSRQMGDAAADGVSLPHFDAEALAHSPQGWSFADGLLTVKTDDSFKPMRLVIER